MRGTCRSIEEDANSSPSVPVGVMAHSFNPRSQEIKRISMSAKLTCSTSQAKLRQREVSLTLLCQSPQYTFPRASSAPTSVCLNLVAFGA